MSNLPVSASSWPLKTILKENGWNLVWAKMRPNLAQNHGGDGALQLLCFKFLVVKILTVYGGLNGTTSG